MTAGARRPRGTAGARNRSLTPDTTPDAVVIGAGPNGLVAANLLADAGWSVEVLEAQDEPGGAVRSDREVHPDYVSDMFSSFYPLAAASPVLAGLDLHEEGLRWSHAPLVLAHPLSDGRCAVLDRDRAATAAGLERFAPGDGLAWENLCDTWDRIGPDVIKALFTPFPPVRSSARLLARLRTAEGLRLARTLLLPVRRMGEEEFRGEGGRLLLAGNALHADLAPESAGSGGFGWLMAMLGQTYGFPVPAGGAGALTAALVRRLERRGGIVRCGERVVEITVRSGRAAAVRTAGGETVAVHRAVLADVAAPALYGELVAPEHLPSRLLDDLRRFQWDWATFKVDWALSGPIPWSAGEAATAGTVHVADGIDELTRFAAQIATGHVPDRPFLLVGQMTTADRSRSPSGTESVWAYTHVPHRVRADAGDDALTGAWTTREQEAMADRMEAGIERFAPGFRDRVRARRILAPPTMERLDANLRDGAINTGTTALHQQLVFRPVPGTGRPETPVEGLYLASAAAHPGGGVHGAPGANAARAALHATRPVRRTLVRAQHALAARGRRRQDR
ncbi:phytoene desaturase family protein [Streptomyces sp. SP18CS02]|uniref:phytoene desaturase family protein n=1 Tax=Streptomyces sp. SP18CS02 TaxID=3002531 RepID=UPI002E79A570|nr:NAD(P)/FAD-dependent oxidoreductase [Streptomyces sp. SP18CS02]MEE1757474.1 NAD(P)/FAD-dependent oxidoreductase [Streptomyces sp. SP18CS02]